MIPTTPTIDGEHLESLMDASHEQRDGIIRGAYLGFVTLLLLVAAAFGIDSIPADWSGGSGATAHLQAGCVVEEGRRRSLNAGECAFFMYINLDASIERPR